MSYFKDIIDELRSNGQIDSGTKIQFLKLLQDLSQFNYSKLRYLPKPPKRRFLMKVVHLKFDLKLSSFKDFCESLQKIDNCAIKYIEYINDSKIYIRDQHSLKIRHFLGEVDATIEASNPKDLQNSEIALKRLADSLNYRLLKKMPSASPLSPRSSSTNALNIGLIPNLHLHNIPSLPLQSPTTSTPDEELTNTPHLFAKLNLKDELLTSIDETSMHEKQDKLSFNLQHLNNSNANMFVF